MGQIVNAADIEAYHPMIASAEAVVIGTGPAGTFAAIKLLQQGHAVLMVEAGGDLPDVVTSPYFDFDSPRGRNPVELGVNWQLGGCSNLWSGRCAPLEETDITASKGWPFEYWEIEGAYEEAAEILGLLPVKTLKSMPTEIAGAKNWERLLASDEVAVKKFQWNTPPFNTGAYLKKLSAEEERLHILTHCRHLSFEGIEKDGRVKSAIFACGNGRRLVISDKVFVLCAGGIETPRVLLNSCEGRGIGNSSGLVGKFFSTHPKGSFGTLSLNRPVSLKSPLFRDTRHQGANLRFGLGLPQESDGARSLNHYVQLAGRFEKIGSHFLEQAQSVFISVSSGAGAGASKRPRQHANRIAIALGRTFFNFLGRSGLWRKRASVLSVRAYFDQFPSERCRISLAEERDPYGMRKAHIDWAFSEEDISSIRDFAQDLKAMFADFGIGDFRPAFGDDPERWKFTAIHSHFLGTTRMGADRVTSVTDAFGRLHDVPNVYICGSAVFPSYGNANPVLSIAALSLRTGKRIAVELDGARP